MRRWHSEETLMRRRLIQRAMFISGTWRNHMGYWRKRSVLDCGRAQCSCCHPGKFAHSKRRRSLDKVAIKEQR